MSDIDRTVIKRLIGSPQLDNNDALVIEAEEKIKELAFREWIDWITGQYRPISVSQNNIDRIAKIYGVVIGNIPNVNELVEIFNLPIGRARYIVSILNYETFPDFRRAMYEKLVSLLNDEISSMDEDEEAEITPFVDASLINILDQLEVEILYYDQHPSYSRYQKLSGYKSIGQECVMSIANARIIIEKLQNKITAI